MKEEPKITFKAKYPKKVYGPPKLHFCKKCQYEGTNFLAHSCRQEMIKRGLIMESQSAEKAEISVEPTQVQKPRALRFNRIKLDSDSESVVEISVDDSPAEMMVDEKPLPEPSKLVIPPIIKSDQPEKKILPWEVLDQFPLLFD